MLAIHAANVAAGAEILTAGTFRTHDRNLTGSGRRESARNLTERAVSIARRAAEGGPRAVFVAGSLSPLEDCYRPDLVPDDAALAREHARQATTLADAGVDLILVETHNTVRELTAAVRAARDTNLPVMASMVTTGRGRLLSGEPIAAAAHALELLSPDAVGINCVPARSLGGELEILAAAVPGTRLIAYGNLGQPGLGQPGPGGGYEEEASPAEYARIADGWLRSGARIVGGCCGTTADHTAALRALIDAIS